VWRAGKAQKMPTSIRFSGSAEQKEQKARQEKRSFGNKKEELLELIPFPIQGNKAALLTKGLGQMVLAAAKSSERIVDAFAGTGLYTHYLRENGVGHPAILNEYDPFRYITHQQLKYNPLGVVLALEYFVEKLCEMVKGLNDGDIFGPDAEAAQACVAGFFQKQAERLIEPGQDLPSLSLKKLPVKMKSTPELAALYVVMQSQIHSNRSIQADATSNGFKKVMSRAEVRTIVNEHNKVKKFRLGRKYLFDSRDRFLAVHTRLKNVSIMNMDAWALIRETVGKGDFVLCDSSYLGEKTQNYNKATNEDRKVDVYERKFQECVLPAIARGAKFLITNNWHEGVVDSMKKFGLKILKINRDKGASVDTTEFVAFNFDPFTGDVDGNSSDLGGKIIV
jgi:hypothetical protein